MRVLTVDSSDDLTLMLTKSGSSWITVERISEDLKSFADANFSNLFDLHPAERGIVILNRDEEVQSHRWHKSYLQTPKRCSGGGGGEGEQQHAVSNSYMFSGRDETDNNAPLPALLVPFFEHMNDAANHFKYNQVVANWYGDGSDYIAKHSDYTNNLTADSDIAIISLDDGGDAQPPRRFTFTVRQEAHENSIYDAVTIKLRHGCVIRMCGTTQAEFRHGVKKELASSARRISLTFRSYTTAA